jgi:hypothetical protein
VRGDGRGDGDRRDRDDGPALRPVRRRQTPGRGLHPLRAPDLPRLRATDHLLAARPQRDRTHLRARLALDEGRCAMKSTAEAMGVAAMPQKPCPFCAGRFFAALHPAAVMHSVPACAKFLALEPVDYLAAVNAAWTRGGGAS